MAFEFPSWCERCHADVDRGIWPMAFWLKSQDPFKYFTAKLRASLGTAVSFCGVGVPT